MHRDLLFEIGVEELPASFVDAALGALPELVRKRLELARLSHGEIIVLGTPRRLAVEVKHLAEAQPALDELVTGPPVRIAFDAEGHPTRAAESFAAKLDCKLEQLERVKTDKGEYLVGHKREPGKHTTEILPELLAQVAGEIPFRKAMRWGNGDTAFGRPVRWLLAVFGHDDVPVKFAGVVADRISYGHRFLAPDPIEIYSPDDYQGVLREHRVIVSPSERRDVMLHRLRTMAETAGGVLIDDPFLVAENCSLVEEPHILVGSFDNSFLRLPEAVILAVARGHQRYFGIRGKNGELLPRYLAVAGTLRNSKNVVRGNDRVMRARLADAEFFYNEDLKVPLGERRSRLDSVMFHKRLGSIGDKVRRIERLVSELGGMLGLDGAIVDTAREAAGLAKNDLVSLMVGEFPELQGEMGRAYALEQGVRREVAHAISEHYQPRGADDSTAPSDAGALLALADRLDTLAGCFAIGLAPTGAADPLALRRAAIGSLRTLIAKGWPTTFERLIRVSYWGFGGTALELDEHATVEKLSEFLRQRLRGVVDAPPDVVEACLAASSDDAFDVSLRAAALSTMAPGVRASVGEVFKRAANIVEGAPDGHPEPPENLSADVHATELALFKRFSALNLEIEAALNQRDYAIALAEIAGFAPILAQFFQDVFVMVDDERVRHNRLRMMRAIHRTCSRVASFNLLTG
jgi:glycyl-tRNA synthetase beta chain